ncbi:hypothetical protein BOX15_Mlig024024g3, partial [Macrostomum lignano]
PFSQIALACIYKCCVRTKLSTRHWPHFSCTHLFSHRTIKMQDKHELPSTADSSKDFNKVTEHLCDMLAMAKADEAQQLMIELMGSSSRGSAGEAADIDIDSESSQLGAQLSTSKYSELVRRELQLTIRLRRLQRGESDEQPSTAQASDSGRTEAQVSEETRQMQLKRREKNRQSAIACRKNRRERENRLKKAVQRLEEENRLLSSRIKKFEQLYRESLSNLPTKMNFQTYLKAHPDLVRDPDVKPVLREFIIHDYPKLPNYIMMSLVPS